MKDEDKKKLSDLKKGDWFYFIGFKKRYIYDGKNKFNKHPKTKKCSFCYFDLNDHCGQHDTFKDRDIVVNWYRSDKAEHLEKIDDFRTETEHVFIQNVCSDCLQQLVAGESDHTPEEFKTFKETLLNWHKLGYTPTGLTEDTQAFFTHSKCDICNGLSGERYEYKFYQK